jgi:hypothetical protein
VTPFSTTLGTNLDGLVLTGTEALVGTANSLNDTLTSNSGIDTLIGGSAGTNSIQSSASYTLPTT